jgi:hypothetical protein
MISITNFGEFMEFFLKGLNAFKYWNQFQIGFVSWIFISKSIWNLNSFPNGKLLLLKLSSSLRSLEFFLNHGSTIFHILPFCFSLNWIGKSPEKVYRAQPTSIVQPGAYLGPRPPGPEAHQALHPDRRRPPFAIAPGFCRHGNVRCLEPPYPLVSMMEGRSESPFAFTRSRTHLCSHLPFPLHLAALLQLPRRATVVPDTVDDRR